MFVSLLSLPIFVLPFIYTRSLGRLFVIFLYTLTFFTPLHSKRPVDIKLPKLYFLFICPKKFNIIFLIRSVSITLKISSLLRSSVCAILSALLYNNIFVASCLLFIFEEILQHSKPYKGNDIAVQYSFLYFSNAICMFLNTLFRFLKTYLDFGIISSSVKTFPNIYMFVLPWFYMQCKTVFISEDAKTTQ